MFIGDRFSKSKNQPLFQVMLSMLIPLTRHPVLYKEFKQLLGGRRYAMTAICTFLFFSTSKVRHFILLKLT